MSFSFADPLVLSEKNRIPRPCTYMFWDPKKLCTPAGSGKALNPPKHFNVPHTQQPFHSSSWAEGMRPRSSGGLRGLSRVCPASTPTAAAWPTPAETPCRSLRQGGRSSGLPLFKRNPRAFVAPLPALKSHDSCEMCLNMGFLASGHPRNSCQKQNIHLVVIRLVIHVNNR